MSQSQPQDQPNAPSLLHLLQTSKTSIQTSPSKSISALLHIQTNISKLSLFSQNETLEDVSTSTIPLLLVEYYLGLCYITLSTKDKKEREMNLNKSKEYLHAFMDKMELLELFKDDEYKDLLTDYHKLIDFEDGQDENNTSKKSYEISRDEKINRFRKKRGIENKIQYYQSLQERRIRLDMKEYEDIDGFDNEGLLRELNVMILRDACYDVLDELVQVGREVDMLAIMSGFDNHRIAPPPPPVTNKPLEVTRINQDPKTGQLILQKEQIKSKVFQPGWNQPTMTLEELGDKEVKAALEREKNQKIAEEEARKAPRRYEQLVRDGLEDDEDLVEQSAVMDRRWDDFKEANPRGSGNKMGHRGDRNF